MQCADARERVEEQSGPDVRTKLKELVRGSGHFGRGSTPEYGRVDRAVPVGAAHERRQREQIVIYRRPKLANGRQNQVADPVPAF